MEEQHIVEKSSQIQIYSLTMVQQEQRLTHAGEEQSSV